MLVLMESLQGDHHPCRTIAQTWLTQALHRGEILRLLQPILFMLLHPDTARSVPFCYYIHVLKTLNFHIACM